MMILEDLLSQKKAAILDRCFRLILETYPADTSRFLKQEKDRFVNPVGHTISQEIEVLFDELLQGMNSAKLSASLENIIKIRAVQDFTPSQAIAFTFLLKKAIREELENEIRKKKIYEELLKFETKIDRVIFLAFDIYMKCRQKIYEIKIDEVKAQREGAFKLLERINLEYGEKEDK